MEIFNIVAFAVWILSISFLVFYIFRLSLKLKSSLETVDQMSLDRELLINKIVKLSSEIDANKLKEDDGFIKFLSQSREWAFSYIEEVQKHMSDFQQTVGPVIDKVKDLDNDDIKTIIEAYENLAKLMPKTESEQTDQKEKK